MTDGLRQFSAELPEPVRAALYSDYPTYRAVITMLDHLAEVPDLVMTARLAKTSETAHDHPVLDFSIDEGRIFLLRINCPNRIFLRFSTRTDLHRFLEAAKPDGAISGRQLAGNPKGWPLYFEMMTAFEANRVDYVRIADALIDVLTASPSRRVACRPDDTELQALLRDINRPQDEYAFDQTFERILDLIDEENFDTVMHSLADFDPMAEEDPGSVPGMMLILMNDLVRERGRFLAESRRLLPAVREQFERLGKHAAADLQETDALIDYIDRALN